MPDRVAPTPVPPAPPRVAGLQDVFTPTRPQRTARRLAGRQQELGRIQRAIATNGSHVVLYGERGRGKTSLVNLVAAEARRAGFMVGRFACSQDSDFNDILRGLMRDLPASLLANPCVQDADLEGCEAALPAGRLQPRDIVALPGRLVGPRLLLITDEFDRVQDVETRTWFADTIKQVSDRAVPLAFIIVGVSENLEQLVGRHPSIQRNILGLPLPLLSDGEIHGILQAGGRDAGVAFPPEICTAIAGIARGVPYVAQLLALHAATQAQSRGADHVSAEDLTVAFARAVEDADPGVRASYESLTRRGTDRDMLAALRAIIEGDQDRYGRFFAIQDPLSQSGVADWQVAGQAVADDIWQRLCTANAVRASPGAGPGAFSFTDPLLPHHILLRAEVGA